MERDPVEETKEANELILDGLYLRETELFRTYIKLFGDPSEEVRDWEYAVGMGAVMTLDTEQSRNESRKNLEEFIAFLEQEIAKKSGADTVT